ncbi:hypothetical protein PROFUN_09732 [Planoprotostelium fungivorum]|uniref:Uncharacterized protein n=1 Tax=Planoprotostelium fungivorum TaxID=1890364 RepID=A0A2P6NEY4_9EUKA|nr:hypothetical protein PROFUN_09732 [Planoprotostelium fungivorum]
MEEDPNQSYIQKVTDVELERLHLNGFCAELSLVNGQILEIENLHNLIHLEVLNLTQNRISKIDNLNRNTNLRVLVLDHNPIRSVQYSSLMPLTQLHTLSLRGTHVYNITAVAQILAASLPSLHKLFFQECRQPDEIPDRTNILDQLRNSFQMLAEHQLSQVTSPDAQLQLEDTEIGDDTGDYRSCTNISASADESEDDSPTELNHDEVDHWSGVLEVEEFHGREVDRYQQSPICTEPYYRGYTISAIPQLQHLDGIEISSMERSHSSELVEKKFLLDLSAYGPPSHLTKLLSKRRMGSFSLFRGMREKIYERTESVNVDRRPRITEIAPLKERNLASHSVYDRDVDTRFMLSGRGQMPSSAHSLMESDDQDHPLSAAHHSPRQFEYCPDPKLPFGRVSDEVEPKVVYMTEQINRRGSNIFGINWLRHGPTRFLAGNDSGDILLFNAESMRTGERPIIAEFQKFSRLSSVSINSDDSKLLAKGGARGEIRLFDMATAKTLVTVEDLHLDSINVLKFSNTNPNLFATSSFDKTIKLWDIRQPLTQPIYTRASTMPLVMVTWSPCDEMILSSGGDNEVRQYHSLTGQLHTKFRIKQTGSPYNYTRAYYMNRGASNTGDYIVVGSCEESVARVYCSHSGRMLTQVELKSDRVPQTPCILPLYLTICYSLTLQLYKKPNCSLLRAEMGDPGLPD